MVQALKELVAYGKEKNILVTLEDFDGPVQPFARMYQLLWFMENVPGLKFTLDTATSRTATRMLCRRMKC